MNRRFSPMALLLTCAVQALSCSPNGVPEYMMKTGNQEEINVPEEK